MLGVRTVSTALRQVVTRTSRGETEARAGEGSCQRSQAERWRGCNPNPGPEPELPVIDANP